MATSEEGRPSGEATLRAEHDELARQLGARRSVDELRIVAYAGFAAALSLGLTAKVAWDRWGWSRVPRPAPLLRFPVLPALAFALFVLLLAVTVRAARRARAHRISEERLIARFEELRRTLRLDP